ncbi:CD63 antigen [Brachionus plicatilis]|uniref:CD63 antigen n=1 Tax=Brachionus plicatilis TaxID=10195 RepID=A0A3M7QFB5_BRAPC|nr:CD63 antigen [Brachionus plicatilis]
MFSSSSPSLFKKNRAEFLPVWSRLTFQVYRLLCQFCSQIFPFFPIDLCPRAHRPHRSVSLSKVFLHIISRFGARLKQICFGVLKFLFNLVLINDAMVTEINNATSLNEAHLALNQFIIYLNKNNSRTRMQFKLSLKSSNENNSLGKKLIFKIHNFILISCSYIGLGSWLLDTVNDKPDIPAVKQNYTIVGGLILSAGLAGFFTALYGFAVSICQNVYSIFIYAVLVVILLLLGVAVGIVGLVYADTSGSQISEFMTKDLFSSNIQLVNEIQTEYKCCGLNGPIDWQELLLEDRIPQSCCEDKNNNCENGPFFQQGCVSSVSESMRLDLAISGGISIAIGLILLLGIILAGNAFIDVLQKNKSKGYENKL